MFIITVLLSTASAEDPNYYTVSDQLQRATHDLEEMTKKCQTVEQQLQEAQKRIVDLTVKTDTQRKQERVAQREIQEIEERIKSTAAAVAERTPSETQKIIANQVELGAGYYEQVGVQSHESFRLFLWLTVAGGCIFLITMLATVFVSFFRGESTLITIISSVAAAITEGLAASNRLYNQASKQFADFRVDLNRINCASISYAMISEEGFEKKTQKQQDAIITITDALLRQE